MRRLLVCLIVLLAVPAWPQERPLPDYRAFLQEARKRLQPDEGRQSGYVYVETRREQKLDESGRATKETVQVFESYPGLPGQRRWERLIEKDGAPVPAAELAKQDRERQQTVMEYARKLERQPAQARAQEERELARERRELNAAIDDVLRIYDIRMLNREAVRGHDTIVFSFTPRPGVESRTPEGKWLRHFVGKVWVSETDYEMVRLEAEAQDTVSVGLGLLARVHKGSRAEFERVKVNGEKWLPAYARYQASARVLLVKRMRMGGTSEYSNYRRFTVSTDTRVGQPK